jgi:rubrerythrin
MGDILIQHKRNKRRCYICGWTGHEPRPDICPKCNNTTLEILEEVTHVKINQTE